MDVDGRGQMDYKQLEIESSAGSTVELHHPGAPGRQLLANHPRDSSPWLHHEETKVGDVSNGEIVTVIGEPSSTEMDTDGEPTSTEKPWLQIDIPRFSVNRLGWLNASPPALEIMLQLGCNSASMGFPQGIDQVVPKPLRYQVGSVPASSRMLVAIAIDTIVM